LVCGFKNVLTVETYLREIIDPKQPKVFGVKFSLREIGGIFFIKIRNFKLWKIPKLINFGFPAG